MYQMTPLYVPRDDAFARHTDTLAKGVLLALAAIVVLALALLLLAATHLAWLRLLNWLDAGSSPVIFRHILGGI